MTISEQATSNRAVSIHQELTAVPTAPFCEEGVLGVLLNILQRYEGHSVQSDEFGNLLVTLGKKDTNEPGVVFVAHVDHPAFIFEQEPIFDEQSGCFILEGLFEGRVFDSFFPNSRLRIYSDDLETFVTGTILSATTVSKETDNRTVLIRLDQRITKPRLGVWNLPSGNRVSEGVIRSAVCDDLAGCAAMIAAIEKLVEFDLGSPVQFLFTRAEEAGFCGLLVALEEGRIRSELNPHSTYLSVEVSSETDLIKKGDGVVIRLGDKRCIFDGTVSNELIQTCQEFEIPYRVALMNKGTCEATPMVMKSLRTGGICIPVQHYHNMNIEAGFIDLEAISESDLQDLTSLIVRFSKDRKQLNFDHDQSNNWELFRSKARNRLRP